VDRSAGGRSMRVNGHIAMSRTMGDSDFKHKGLLVCTPDIFHRDVKPGDEQIVLATDGLWDSVNDTNIVKTVKSSAMSRVANNLSAEATNRGTTDNTTVIVIDLRGAFSEVAPPDSLGSSSASFRQNKGPTIKSSDVREHPSEDSGFVLKQKTRSMIGDNTAWQIRYIHLKLVIGGQTIEGSVRPSMNIYRWIMEWSDTQTSTSRKARVLDMAYGAVREVNMDEKRPDGDCRYVFSVMDASTRQVIKLATKTEAETDTWMARFMAFFAKRAPGDASSHTTGSVHGTGSHHGSMHGSVHGSHHGSMHNSFLPGGGLPGNYPSHGQFFL